jgi:TRAP-type C4-dicarboxylate transport system substrate-binding protein
MTPNEEDIRNSDDPNFFVPKGEFNSLETEVREELTEAFNRVQKLEKAVFYLQKRQRQMEIDMKSKRLEILKNARLEREAQEEMERKSSSESTDPKEITGGKRTRKRRSTQKKRHRTRAKR